MTTHRQTAFRAATQLIFVLFCTFGIAQSASASLIRFEYSGTLSSIAYFRGADNSYGMTVGQRVSGSFVVDTNEPDQNADPTKLFITNSLRNIAFQQFGASAPYLSYSSLFLDANPLIDQVSAYANALSPNISDVFEFTLTAPAPSSVLGTTGLDLTTLRLGDFDPFSVNFSFQRAVDVGGSLPQVTQFFAVMDALSVRKVPEPQFELLLAAVLLALAFATRRNTGGTSAEKVTPNPALQRTLASTPAARMRVR